tara:strand:+ start:19 stop:984 length:966 start_codon:yes stop_codon:yes gene_type:complete
MVDGVKVEHVLMFGIVVFLLYHFMSGCGCANRGDGFNVGGQPAHKLCHGSLTHDGPTPPGWCLIDGMDDPKTCGIRNDTVVTKADCKTINGCNWFPTAVEDSSKNQYKCKNLQDLYVDTLDENCSSSYKEKIWDQGTGVYEERDFGHTLPLNVYWSRTYDNPPSACEVFNVCLPQNIEHIGWEDTSFEQPCKNECDGTHTPFVYENGNSGDLVERSGWDKLGNITQSDLGHEDAGCYWDKKEWDNYDGCTLSRRALCFKETKTCPTKYVKNCDLEMKDCNNKYSQNLTDNKYHMCKKGTVFGCQAGGYPCSKPMEPVISSI